MEIEEKDICELALCETRHIYLKPNQLYRFVIIPDCKECERLAKEAELPPFLNVNSD